MRVKRGFKRRYKRSKMAKVTRGFYGKRKNSYHMMRIAVMRSWLHAYEGRRLRKRDMRRLWQIRIAAAVRSLGWSYSRFMGALKTHGVQLNRKMLAHLAVYDPQAFQSVVEFLRSSSPGEMAGP